MYNIYIYIYKLGRVAPQPILIPPTLHFHIISSQPPITYIYHIHIIINHHNHPSHTFITYISS